VKGIEGSTERRHQLDERMDARRNELRVTWTEIARRAGMTPQNLVRIRKGQISISWDAADGIERALRWERGSVEAAVLEGKPPTKLASPQSDSQATERQPDNDRHRRIRAALQLEGIDPTPERVAAVDQIVVGEIARLEAMRKVAGRPEQDATVSDRVLEDG
jgi:transcriptional regulator with XRE-family HTH domain